jgi:hypothetical protein
LEKLKDLQQREQAPWRSSRPATEGTCTLEKLKTFNRRVPATWKSSILATKGISTLQKPKTCNIGNSTLEKLKACNGRYQHQIEAQYLHKRGNNQPREAQDLQQRRSAP